MPLGPPHPFILAFGDSLTAGYGLQRHESFAAQLERSLRERHPTGSVHNAGVSGDTTSGGRARLPRVLSALPQRPDLAIVELGANDLLRGIDPDRARDNLDWILRELARCGIPALLAGMVVPAFLAPGYVGRFNAIFATLAQAHRVPLYPSFLNGVAGQPGLTLPDGLHPNATAIGIVARAILPHVEAALARPIAQAA